MEQIFSRLVRCLDHDVILREARAAEDRTRLQRLAVTNAAAVQSLTFSVRSVGRQSGANSSVV